MMEETALAQLVHCRKQRMLTCVLTGTRLQWGTFSVTVFWIHPSAASTDSIVGSPAGKMQMNHALLL